MLACGAKPLPTVQRLGVVNVMSLPWVVPAESAAVILKWYVVCGVSPVTAAETVA